MSRWTDAQIDAAWLAADPIPFSPDRQTNGWRMKREEYGKFTECGWHVGHIFAERLGGSDAPWNLRAQHWYDNCREGGHIGNAMSVARQYSNPQPRNAMADAFVGWPVPPYARRG